MSGMNREMTINSVFYKYLEIKQDLMNNLREVFLRPNYYSKKYRGNINTDINVGIMENDLREHRVQIFVRHGGIWVRDIMIYDSKGLKESQIKTNMYE